VGREKVEKGRAGTMYSHSFLYEKTDCRAEGKAYLRKGEEVEYTRGAFLQGRVVKKKARTTSGTEMGTYDQGSGGREEEGFKTVRDRSRVALPLWGGRTGGKGTS